MLVSSEKGTSLQPYEDIDPSIYVTSQWQQSSKVTVPYLAYRWLIAAAALGTALISFLTPYSGMREKPPADAIPLPAYFKWFIYATNMGFSFIVLQSLLGLYLTQLLFILQRRNSKDLNSNNICNGNSNKVVSSVPKEESESYTHPMRIKRLCSLYRLYYTAAAAFAFEITFMYWGVVHDPDLHVIDAVNLLSHCFNSVLMLIDTLMVRMNTSSSDLPHLPCIGLAYGVSTYFYWLAGGTDRVGKAAIYSCLDWEKPRTAALFALAVGAFTLLGHLLHLPMQAARNAVHSKCIITHKNIRLQEQKLK